MQKIIWHDTDIRPITVTVYTIRADKKGWPIIIFTIFSNPAFVFAMHHLIFGMQKSLDYVSDYELESTCKDAPLHSPI